MVEGDKFMRAGLYKGWLPTLFVGNLLPVKNPDLLLRAFAQFSGSPRLVIAGKGPLRPKLEELAASLGIADRVQFLGPQLAPQIAEQMRPEEIPAEVKLKLDSIHNLVNRK